MIKAEDLRVGEIVYAFNPKEMEVFKLKVRGITKDGKGDYVAEGRDCRVDLELLYRNKRDVLKAYVNQAHEDLIHLLTIL